MRCWQDLFPPLFALVAASAEVNAARGAAMGQQGTGAELPQLRRSMAGLASMDSTGSQAYYALVWAAGSPLRFSQRTVVYLEQWACLGMNCASLGPVQLSWGVHLHDL